MKKVTELFADNPSFKVGQGMDQELFLRDIEEFFNIEIWWDENSISASYPYFWKIGDKTEKYQTAWQWSVIKAFQYLINNES